MRDPGPFPFLGTPDEQDDWFRRAEAKKKWDEQHTYVIDMIKVLFGRKHGVRNVDFHQAVWDTRRAAGEPMPKKFGATIESVLNQYSSQRQVFQRRRRTEKDDLFHTPKKGFWKLWSDERAIAWYRRKIGEDL
jgi:hypothetical protein